MANAEILRREDEIPPVSIFGTQKGEIVSSRGQLIERKIDALESLAGKVSNRRSRKWLNDRLLIELVPRLKVEEIRGLFAPPPWGDDTPLSAFCMTNVGEWDAFRNIDMDKEASLIQGLETSSTRRKGHVDSDKMAALNAWHRVDCRTREALRRSSLFDLVERFEDRIRSFIRGTVDGDTLVLHVQDPLHRLLLHGICEFYGLTSVTVSTSKNMKLWKMMKIKKKLGSREITPDLTLVGFLKMTKNGVF